MKSKTNNYAFIDSQNLNLGVKSQGWTLDFAKFRVFLRDKYAVQKAYLFIGYVQGNEILYTNLQKCGFICVFKPTLEINNKGVVKIKGNVDAELVLHSMIEFRYYDKAIIVSGDGDFHCIIQYLANQNKLEKIIVPNQRFSTLLKKYAPYISNIQLFKEKVQTKKSDIPSGQNPLVVRSS